LDKGDFILTWMSGAKKFSAGMGKIAASGGAFLFDFCM
jgi:hypothetical protein